MSQILVILLLIILWMFDVSTWLSAYITPLSQCIILVFYLRAQAKWNYRGRVSYRQEDWVKKTYSRMSFKTVWFFPIWLLFCWLASENTWYIISYLYLMQLLIGINMPRIEYRMTRDTEAGLALREYAKKEFTEEKMEQQEYALYYQPHLAYKTHEYYWFWQMQGESWIFRIKAFSQFMRDIIFRIFLFILTGLTVPFFLFYPLMAKKYNMEQLDVLNGFFSYTLSIVSCIKLYYVYNYSYKYHAWNYFFYNARYPGEAAGPYKEKPGTWEYYYYLVLDLFPEKYRDLQNALDLKRLLAAGIDPDQDWLTEEEEEAADDLIGASKVNIDDFDSEGGSDDADLMDEEQDDDDDDSGWSPAEKEMHNQREAAHVYAEYKKEQERKKQEKQNKKSE